MPELPEVETTVRGLRTLIGETITDVWTDLNSPFYKNKEHIKDPEFFAHFKKEIRGKKITSVSRMAKYIVIHLEKKTHIIVHMKMTGHLMVGDYIFHKKENRWTPKDKNSPLADPYNRFVHTAFILKSGKTLVLSDARKFATVTLFIGNHKDHKDLAKLGPDPLSDINTWKEMRDFIQKRANLPMKQALLDQTLVSGIGNIYSDEILFEAGVSPFRKTIDVTDTEWKNIFKHTRKILVRSIGMGGDSLSDYRNAFGEKGGFQNFHKAYGRRGEKCPKNGCGGIIQRTVLGGRSAHYCDKHQR